MTKAAEAFSAVVSSMTQADQPFALNTVDIDGHTYRNYAQLPDNLGAYFQIMLGHGDKEFAVYLDQRYTFAQSYAHSAAFATALQRDFGIQPGDRVAIASRNNPQWMMAFIGIVSIGAVAVPMNAWWTTQELEYGFSDSGAKVVVADRTRAERLAPVAADLGLRVIAIDDCADLELSSTPFSDMLNQYSGAEMPAVAVSLDDPATIMYTSGSTGHPKGALSSHRGILSALFSWMLMGLATKQVGAGEQADVERLPPAALLTIPLFHCTASHSAFMLSVVVGRKLVIMHKWDVQEAMRLIEEEKITWFNGVPTMSAELQAAAETSDRDLSSLEEIMAGGAARPPEQVKKLTSTFKQSSAGIGYGLTETNAIGTVNSGAFYVEKPNSAGRIVPAVTEVRVIDGQGNALSAGERGELCLKSPANVLGYWNKPEATAEAFVDGWFHTGDVAYLDDEGFVYIVDRIKDIVIRGGENISCIEVEAALYTHPAVQEAAVFGLPDERLGEIVGAAIVCKPGETVEVGAMRDYLGTQLAAFKVPAHLWVREEQLPRIASGKIFKRELKAHYTALLAQA